MLSLLPEMMFLAPFSAFLIRIALASTLTYAAWNHFSGTSNGLATAEILASVAIIAGAWTQIGAIVGALIICVWLAFPQSRNVSRGTAFLALVLCLSLIVTGPGAIAFDLPL